MKNTYKTFGIIALIVVIGFTIASCSNGTTNKDIVPEELQGTWIGTGSNNVGWKYVFKGNLIEAEEGIGNTCKVTNLYFKTSGGLDAEFTKGYIFGGVISSATGSTMANGVRDGFDIGFYLNTDKNKILWRGGSGYIFQKQ